MNKPLASPELLLVRQLLTQHQEQAGGLLPLLHAVQEALGFIPANAVPLIAEGMNLSRAEVHGAGQVTHVNPAFVWFAWAAVGIPLAWGIYRTIQSVAKFFN